MIAAVIPAAGSGARFSTGVSSLAKQYQPLAGEPVYLWSLSTFCKHNDIEKVVLVVAPDMVEAARANLDQVQLEGKGKVSVVAGGATRQKSVHLGMEVLSTIEPPPLFVLVHDAARPFVSESMIDDTIKCVTEKGACTLALPLTDTIKRVHAGVIAETIDRTALYLIQTPQAGRFDWLLDAHRKAAANGFETTDDAAILENAGYEVSIVSGSRYNLKITNPEDMLISEAIAPIVLSEPLGAKSRIE